MDILQRQEGIGSLLPDAVDHPGIDFAYLCRMSFHVYIVFICFILVSCGREPQPATPKIFNPNGDSELALLMRDMFDDGVQIKTDLLNGKAPKLRTEFLKIHTAIPTEEGKNATPEYLVYARAYEDAVKSFQTSTPYNRVGAYQHMVNSCIHCHAEVCPGPVRKIRKLEFTKEELLSLNK